MFVRKRKEFLIKKKAIADGLASEENLQSLRVWIRKIEQTTTSVSSRLSAVEKRLSGGLSESDTIHCIGMEGPIETLIMKGKKKNSGDLARLLDGELTVLHNEVVKQQQETLEVKERLEGLQKTHGVITEDLRTVQTAQKEINIAVEQRIRSLGRPEPFVMHVGALAVPIEFTGIIGGALAFLIAILVIIDQKAILLSPLFLCAIGLLLIGVALLKMIRNRSHTRLYSRSSIPLKPPTTQVTPAPPDKKEG